MYKLFLALVLATTAICAAEQRKFAIEHGPYLQNVGENSATVVWTTSDDAISWVEVSPDDGTHFYAQERPKYFESPLGKKRIGKLHTITIDGLEPTKVYNYRIFSKQVLETGRDNKVLYGPVASSAVYKKEPLKIPTLNPDKKTLKFCMVNDIHEDSARLRNLLSHADKDCDFIVLNGDMVNSMESEAQLFKGFMDEMTSYTGSSKPIYFARGNHETRGGFSERYMDYFPTPTGMPYYYFKAGPAIFIFLDGGEDKPDSDIEYFDTADFDKYRTQQAKWLEGVLNSDDFKNAEYRIIITHIPPSWGSWHGSLHFKKVFAPILKDKRIDLILSGHLHRQDFYPADKDGFDSPNVVNSNVELLSVAIGDSSVKLDFTDVDGKTSRESMEFKIEK